MLEKNVILLNLTNCIAKVKKIYVFCCGFGTSGKYSTECSVFGWASCSTLLLSADKLPVTFGFSASGSTFKLLIVESLDALSSSSSSEPSALFCDETDPFC